MEDKSLTRRCKMKISSSDVSNCAVVAPSFIYVHYTKWKHHGQLGKRLHSSHSATAVKISTAAVCSSIYFADNNRSGRYTLTDFKNLFKALSRYHICVKARKVYFQAFAVRRASHAAWARKIQCARMRCVFMPHGMSGK
jgi:hypothetical protein